MGADRANAGEGDAAFQGFDDDGKLPGAKRERLLFMRWSCGKDWESERLMSIQIARQRKTEDLQRSLPRQESRRPGIHDEESTVLKLRRATHHYCLRGSARSQTIKPRVPVDSCRNDRTSVRGKRSRGRVACVVRIIGWFRFHAAWRGGCRRVADELDQTARRQTLRRSVPTAAGPPLCRFVAAERSRRGSSRLDNLNGDQILLMPPPAHIGPR